MNEPLITIDETDEGRSVRRFANGNAPHKPITEPDFGQLRHFIPMLVKAGLRRLARR